MAVLTGVESTFLAEKKVEPEDEETPSMLKIRAESAEIEEEKKLAVVEPLKITDIEEPVVKKREIVAEPAKVEEGKKRASLLFRR